MHRVFTTAALMLLAVCLLAAPAWADDDEVWLSAARKDAERDGYRLISTEELAKLVRSENAPLIIDARADYEFEAERIPGSLNLEFDLGDRTDISPEKRAAFERLAGPDRKRLMVIYCRSFR